MAMKTTWQITWEAVRNWIADGSFQLAAALSFFALISLAPLVTVSLTVASLFYGRQAVQGELVGQITHYVGQAGAEVVQTVLASASRSNSGIAGLLGVVMMVIGGSAVFLQLQIALNAVWNVAPRADLPWTYTIKVRLFSMALVLGVGLLLLISTIASTGLAAITESAKHFAPLAATLWQLANFAAGLLLETVVFAAVFKVLPDAIIRWREAWIGAGITAVLFEVGRFGIGIYLGQAAPGSAYGAAASLIALLLWLNYSTLIVLLGAEFAQVIARRSGRRIEPSAHAIRTDKADPSPSERRPTKV